MSLKDNRYLSGPLRKKEKVLFRGGQSDRNLEIYNAWRSADQTYEEIGLEHGLTKQRVHQIIRSVIEKLKER